MRNALLVSLCTSTLLMAGSAHAASVTASTDLVLGGLTNSVEGTSDLTSSIGDSKIVRAAREDAAHYVGSDGALRGSHLEAALRHIRGQMPGLQASDLQLAQAILAL
ncbi:DUF2388 domain-containing protein [Stutzerimonas kirkiae]|uniref:Holliday junction resolvasome, helicase subunit n=1 Tax=Stutzerimonas kirkiae TaxID=2211392 RepID=A0A4Q9R7J3_9GAMM|nr:DUF2388 domain-containing protein [Stutzerimonas kirkiae]TBU96545.1 holliday junction resolvasome, helicase subunit [Stutzerimonas kirkiae]TBV02171.1 holliday junction resolvasome, helicase subunit [Stutzerimonas kirkiae]TBV08840.1 holliday junction resolvasome, helicase subunit [Stutzerimonas kirkiae]TBV15676.1 holliday junction resolvasome, helicase subunit [Stutzerimonas kirkiae]